MISIASYRALTAALEWQLGVNQTFELLICHEGLTGARVVPGQGARERRESRWALVTRRDALTSQGGEEGSSAFNQAGLWRWL